MTAVRDLLVEDQPDIINAKHRHSRYQRPHEQLTRQSGFHSNTGAQY
jgi:hypothetical protein